MNRNTKAVLTSGIGCPLLFGGIFGYRYIFASGLEHLPPEVCSGAVDRKLAIDALPPSRSAEEGAKTGTPGTHFFFSCHVYADDDSILSGEAKAADSSVDTWVEYYEDKRDGVVARSKRGPVQMLALSGGLVSVYVPCTPPRIDPDSAVQSYALVTEARTIGETRAKGDDLRQVVTDFAYALTRHAYEVGRCQEGELILASTADAKTGRMSARADPLLLQARDIAYGTARDGRGEVHRRRGFQHS